MNISDVYIFMNISVSLSISVSCTVVCYSELSMFSILLL